MASTGAILVGVYGLVRGLLSILAGIAFAIGGSIISAAGSAGGGNGLAALGGLVTIIGIIMILAAVVMWAGSIGLFLEKSWAPLLVTITFGVLVLLSLLGIVQGGGIGVVTILMLVLDAAATGWGAMNAPQIPVGNGQKQAQAV